MSSRFPRFGIVCMGAGFILLGIFSLLVAVMLGRHEWRYVTNGAQTVGRVSDTAMRTDPRHGGTQTVYEVLYTFQDAGQATQNGHDHVPADAWARAKRDDPVAIQYVTEDPTINRIARNRLTGILPALVAAPVGAVLIALGVFLLAKRHHIRTR
jgi:Protein of unknown function (DUF3592)